MQIDPQTKSKSLLGVTDLTLVATIRRGLIPALDSRSYESRLRLLLKTLNTLHISSFEVKPTPLIADAVDRIRGIHSFRLAIVGQVQRQLLLSVGFDGGWEPYMRRIWRDLGPLLDVIFCNCDDYLSSNDHSFAEYTGWVRKAQVGTEFFYHSSSLTINDLHYLREEECKRIDGAAPGAERPNAQQYVAQARPALTALYRLTDMYPPPLRSDAQPALAVASDSDLLQRAARLLLPELEKSLSSAPPPPVGGTPTERAALDWFSGYKPPPITAPAKTACRLADAQGGIIAQYEDITHACLLLIGLEDAAAAGALLGALSSTFAVTSAAHQGLKAKGRRFVNVGFTYQGLQLAGLGSGDLEQLPFEFREGMAARAGILGDLRYNHPTRWSLPERNGPDAPAGDRVQLSSVHAVVQFSLQGTPSIEWQPLDGDDSHPLAGTIKCFSQELAGSGVRILSVQPMQRFTRTSTDLPQTHFGFADGLSQPTLKEAPLPAKYPEHVEAGDLLLGHVNSLDDLPLTGRLWDDSTFLVIRKLKQNVEALDDAIKGSGLDANLVKAKLMGRSVSGFSLANDSLGNQFNYAGDPDGAKCPLQSHVRRANPRATRKGDQKTVPRIIRRGMSYGPLPPHPDEERGLVFMAYNASIAEQFEVIQSWLSGGNSSSQNTYSALRDPFLGVPQDDDPRTYRFKDAHGDSQQVRLAEPKAPFVKLEWGLYVFVPSLPALDELMLKARDAARMDKPKDQRDTDKKKDQRAIRRSVLTKTGATVIAALNQTEQALGFEAAKTQWKTVLEDVSYRMSGASQAVWAAVRELNGGVLRTPYGVLVCSKNLVMDVFNNSQNRYTVSGYAERMRKSFGEIYLGMDDGTRYQRESQAANAAIMAVEEKDGFKAAFEQTQTVVRQLVSSAVAGVAGVEVTMEVKDVVDGVLAGLSEKWFGVPDGTQVVGGGWHWSKENLPPTCPGHFHSPSRYIFQPNPGDEAAQVGERHGQRLREAVLLYVEEQRQKSRSTDALLARGLFDSIPDPNENGRLASTLIGVMMGFLPTVDGNLRGLLYEWVNDRSLWDHQIAYLSSTGADAFERASRSLRQPLQRTLLLRPVPELVWRTALTRHNLGPLEVTPGERIVVSIVSAAQELLLDDVDDDKVLSVLFGGLRADSPHPTHACPGYKMATGVMLGLLAGLLETAQLTPTLSPMALRVSLRPASQAAAQA